jgi:hypothetical protein
MSFNVFFARYVMVKFRREGWEGNIARIRIRECIQVYWRKRRK